MGTDNLHHRRKTKSVNEFARKKAKRAPYAKVLIVCEGEKTEPNYFEWLKGHFRLNNANITVTGKCGSDPHSVVDHAIRRYKADRASDAFDKVFCVFDRDMHDTYQKALDRIDSIKPKNTFVAIPSVPCFEYWLLLHFEYTSASFHSAGTKSAGDRVIDKLRKYLPDYQKGDRAVFDQLVQRLPQAVSHAARARKDAMNNNSDNPSTLIFELVDYLQKINRP